jgi:phosphoribosylanthranilate isomerase
MAIQAGASAIGLVGHMPSGPGVIEDDLIAEIISMVPPPVATFLLTSETSSEAIIMHHQKVHSNTIQLVDDLDKGSYEDIRKALPAIKIVQVVHVTGEESIDHAHSLANQIDALLLDSGNPNLDIKILGGTGIKHDWRISRRIVEEVDVPVFLAGGLNSENVREAMDQVRPFGIDLCNGVRSLGKLDLEKLEAFFQTLEEW